MKKYSIFVIMLLTVLFHTSVFADSWICQECKSENSGNFCTNCGKAFSDKWFCSGCGAENNGRFCGNCGKERENNSNDVTDIVVKEDNRDKELTGTNESKENMTLFDYMTTSEFLEPESNYALVTVEDTSILFYLAEARISGDWIIAEFISYNPLGKKQYRLLLNFDMDMKADTYMETDFKYHGKANHKHLSIALYDNYYSASDSWGYSNSSVYGSLGTYDFEIVEKSDDWMSYTVKTDVKKAHKPSNEEWSTFSFTAYFNANEVNPVVEKMAKVQSDNR